MAAPAILTFEGESIAELKAAPMRPGNLSERSARRLLDRLVALGVLRELSRPSFRLYGL